MSRAASRRNITQPAFSRRIQSFETWLGRNIVARGANRIAIEPALLANKAELQALVAHIQELRRRIARYDPGRSTVTLAAQHSLIVSAFPDFAARAVGVFPELGFRVRAGNQSDCISLFLSGETTMLMCYEVEGGGDLPFDRSVLRVLWGRDRLVPVVGGKLRFGLTVEGRPPDDAPVILYPPNSFFGDLLSRSRTSYPARSERAVIESAFVAGIKEMALAGLGAAWLPMSIVHRELQSGALVVWRSEPDTVPLRIVIFGHASDETAVRVCKTVSAG